MKNCLVFLDNDPASERRLDFAAAFATPHGAHLTAFALTPEPTYMFAAASVAAAAVWTEQLERARRDAAATAQKLTERLERGDLAFDVRFASLQVGAIARTAARHARYSDLSIIGYASDGAQSEVAREIFEGTLFEAGRPVLVTTDQSDAEQAQKRIMIAWDGSRQAARAVADAMPLLKRAEAVSVVVVDPEVSSEGHGEEPGGDIALSLARHNVSVDVHQVPRAGRTIGGALLSQARDYGAGLIVMGGFGHSMLRESLFGGVSQELLDAGGLPLFMSH